MTDERWRTALRIANRLGIAPEAFWRLSLAEWRALTGPPERPFDRRDLAGLLARFPDHDPTARKEAFDP